MEILLSQRAVTIYEIIAIVILVVVLVRQSKQKKMRQERRQISNAKMRNAQLEDMLRNPDSREEWSRRPDPFDVQYVEQAKAEIHGMPRAQMEIEVHTDTSVQRYLFDLNQELTIGRDEKNVLPINDKMAAKRSCLIYMKNRAVYLKNMSAETPIFVQRGKNKQVLQKESVKLQSKDIITVGRTALHISIYEN